MRVTFNTYPMAFDVPGGGEMQLMAYYKYLPKYGIFPTLFDLWNPALDETDLVHYFSVFGGSRTFCTYIKNIGLPLFISSSLWITEETKDLYPYDEIMYLLTIADLVIANSDIEGDQLSSIFKVPRNKFVTVYNGVEEQFLTPMKRDCLDALNLNAPFLLNIGNIEPRKNQLNLVKAVKKMNQNLIIIGYIRDQAYANECFKEGGNNVKYIGSLPHNAELIRSAMSNCAAFVMPSMLETPSLAALEAAAQGARLVITEVGSTREYFRSFATYVNPNDVNSIANGIETALSLPPSEKLKELIKNEFTWDINIKKLADIYRKYNPQL